MFIMSLLRSHWFFYFRFIETDIGRCWFVIVFYRATDLICFIIVLDCCQSHCDLSMQLHMFPIALVLYWYYVDMCENKWRRRWWWWWSWEGQWWTRFCCLLTIKCWTVCYYVIMLLLLSLH